MRDDEQAGASFDVVDADGALRCPRCGDCWTHVDLAYIAARREDADFNEIRVNAVTGAIQTHRAVQAPTEQCVGTGRRHRIAVAGYCEICGTDFAIVFAQHKGTTYVGISTVTEPVETRPGSYDTD